jgi:ABC-2 type transport system permease protein
MLWYKAWRESRGRFFVCLALMLLPGYNFLRSRIFRLDWEPDVPSLHFRHMFEINAFAVAIWVFAAILLGLGGLMRERATGSSAFTLTLPVSRTRVVATRAGVGILELLILAVLPWVVNVSISLYRQTPFSLSQAGWCILLLMGGGIVYFALSILVSSMVEGEYTAAAASFGLVILSFVLARNYESLKKLFLFPLISGVEVIDRQSYLFTGALPWSTLLASITVAALMVLTSIAITRQRDF